MHQWGHLLHNQAREQWNDPRLEVDWLINRKKTLVVDMMDF